MVFGALAFPFVTPLTALDTLDFIFFGFDELELAAGAMSMDAGWCSRGRVWREALG